MIDSASHILRLPAYCHENLIQASPPLEALPHRFKLLFPDLVGGLGTETTYPMPLRFWAGIDLGFME